jgi:integrase/recombinase XerD
LVPTYRLGLAGCGLALVTALIPALQGKAVPRQCRGIPLILHSAQAAPDHETSVFDQPITGSEPAPSASVTAHDAAAPASGDAVLIALWLDGRPSATRHAYEADAAALLACLGGVPLGRATLADLQAFAASLARLAPSSRARRLAAVKSLFSFGHRIGWLPADVARSLRLPRVKNVLAERILEEAEVARLIALEPDRRNHALLRLLYLAGLRLSEAAALHWRDLRKRGAGGQVTVFGKGGKTRAVLLPASLWRELAALRGDAPDEAPMFRSREGGASGQLSPSQVHRVVKAAARRAGLDGAVSAHWLRHAHASHALDRGAPLHLVQATLGHADLKTTGRYTHARPTESSATYLVG